MTATNGGDGLRLFMSGPVDAIVLDYHLGLLDGAVVASEIKRIRPKIPVVMLAESLDLPDGALKSVDAVVAKSDGPHFLLETVQSVLGARSGRTNDGNTATRTGEPLRCPSTPAFDRMARRRYQNGTVPF